MRGRVVLGIGVFVAAVTSIAVVWTLSGCSGCGGDACPGQAFVLNSPNECVTKVETCSGTIKPAKMVCNDVRIFPPPDAGVCDVVATLESGTTLSFAVTFTVKGRNGCCGNEYEISPPSITIGGPGTAGPDAGADALDLDAPDVADVDDAAAADSSPEAD